MSSYSFAEQGTQYSLEERYSRDFYIKQIVAKYDDYTENTYFDRFSTLGLARILEYGDERAMREEYELVFDSGANFYTNPNNGMRVTSTHPLDPHFQAKEDVWKLKTLSKNNNYKNIVGMKKYTSTEQRALNHLEILRGLQDGKYKQLLNSCEHNIKEIAYTVEIGNIRGPSNLLKFLAACIVKYGSVFYIDVTNQDIKYEINKLGESLELSLNNSTDKLNGSTKSNKIVNAYKRFSLSSFNSFTLLATGMKFYQTRKRRFCEENRIYEKYGLPKWKEIPDRLIQMEAAKIFAHRYVSELFNRKIIKEPIPINNLISEFECHYKGFFTLKQNISIVISVLSVRLFNPHLAIPFLIRNIMNIDEIFNDDVLYSRIQSQCRMKEQKTRTLDDSASIKDLIELNTISSLSYEQDGLLEYDIDEILELSNPLINRLFGVKIKDTKEIELVGKSSTAIDVPDLWDNSIIIIRKQDLSILNYASDNNAIQPDSISSLVVPKLNQLIYFFNKKDG